MNSTEKEAYIAPDIEVVEIETEQNILSSGSVDNFTYDDEPW